MSGENVEAVRTLFDGWSRGDFRAGPELYDPDVEFISEFGVDRVTARGPEGMRRAWREHLSNWETWRTGEIQELREIGDCVVVRNAVHGRGRHSGAEVEISDAAVVFRFRDGRIVWMLATNRVDVALEAAGLGDPE